MEFKHLPVMKEECILNLNIKPNGVYIDCTMGGAGHSSEIVKRLNKNGTFIGIDKDVDALSVANERLKDAECKTYLIHDDFKNYASILKSLGIEKADDILIDLGVSSYQIDNSERGFSYNQTGPLDMRMNQEDPLTAKEIINAYSENELTHIFYKFGEESLGRQIAKKIVKMREDQEISTTTDLVNVIKSAVPTKLLIKNNTIAKVFQALRIAVNRELDGLDKALKDMIASLNAGGRLCVMEFQSLEGKIVKESFRMESSGCICDKNIPVCVCGHKPSIKMITKKPIEPSAEEIRTNKRSASAKLRVIEKL